MKCSRTEASREQRNNELKIYFRPLSVREEHARTHTTLNSAIFAERVFDSIGLAVAKGEIEWLSLNIL